MEVICVSKNTHMGAKELTGQLARRFDCSCLGREERSEVAANEGIAVGRMGVAVLTPGIFSKRPAPKEAIIWPLRLPACATRPWGQGWYATAEGVIPCSLV